MHFNYYKDFTIEDFVQDAMFKRWVLLKDNQLDSFWSSLMEKHPSLQNNIIEARELILDIHSVFEKDIIKNCDDEKDSEEFIKLLEEEIQSQNKSNSNRDNPIRLISFSRRTWTVAVSIAVLIYFMINQRDLSTTQYSTTFGEWKTITLPDGSVVELNANSLLTIPKHWSENNNRTVWLTGEAFFKVKKIPSTKCNFIVKTKDLKVEVLGTSFSVNSRFDQTEVFLEEGKVKLYLGNTKEYMAPGEFIVFSKKKKKIKERHKNAKDIHSSWKNGVLTIKNKQLGDILDEMESIYGLEIYVKNKSRLTENKTISIPVDDLKLAKSILERTLGSHIELKDNNLIVR